MPGADQLTAAEAAAEMGITREHFRKLRAQGKGPVSYKFGKYIYVHRTDLDDYLAAQRERTRRGEGVGV